jgi:glutathione synthase/RimK-type ligase-like ATP-grasp enzyme
MAKLVVVPHNMKSQGAKELASTLSRKLGYKVYRVTPANVRRRQAFRLNGGTDKLTQLMQFTRNNVTCPEYTEDIEVAKNWIIEDGATVMCRTLLRASEGRGIVIADRVDQLVNCRLYTKYVPKKEEYRVHVFNGQVIDVQQKRKKRDFDDTRDTKIRNVNNGYVFCREGIREPDTLRQLAINATQSLRYTLGAVDIAYNVKHNRLVVLEVNATPGMQGTTLEKYADAIVRSL